MNAWERTAAYYRASLAELEKMPTNPAVEEAITDARLEIAKALGAQARVPSIDAALRKKLLGDIVADTSAAAGYDRNFIDNFISH